MSRFPDYFVNSVFDINLDVLKDRGIENVLLDMDNTILSREEDEINEYTKAWVINLKAQGFKVCIISNNWAKRLAELAGDLNIEIVSKAVKPLPFAFFLSLRKLGARPHNTVMIGDQLFTDVMGARLLNILTIMVRPMSAVDLKHTLALRKVEKLILKDRGPEPMLSQNGAVENSSQREEPARDDVSD